MIRGDLSAVDCDDCKAQVLELIEREAIDPDGVRAILAKCPDCRAELEATKALLALTRELPAEAPPARVDAAILRAAESRHQAAGSPERAPWRQPLAMAAVAMLAVGIGVSTVSIVGRPQDELASAPGVDDDAVELEAPMMNRDESADQVMEGSAPRVGAELAAAPPLEEQSEKQAKGAPSAPRPARAPVRSARKKEAAKVAAKQRRQPAQADLEVTEYAVADAPAARAGSAASGAASQESVAAEEDADVDTRADRQCARTVQAFEKRRRKDAEYEPTPEAQLEAGLCYRRLGNDEAARRWLRRAAEHPSTKARANEALGEIE